MLFCDSMGTTQSQQKPKGVCVCSRWHASASCWASPDETEYGMYLRYQITTWHQAFIQEFTSGSVGKSYGSRCQRRQVASAKGARIEAPGNTFWHILRLQNASGRENVIF